MTLAHIVQQTQLGPTDFCPIMSNRACCEHSALTQIPLDIPMGARGHPFQSVLRKAGPALPQPAFLVLPALLLHAVNQCL